MSVQVLVLASRRQSAQRITEVAPVLSSKGCLVRLASQYELTDGSDRRSMPPSVDVHVLRVAADGYGPAFRRQVRSAEGPARFWAYVSHDRWVAREIERSRVVLGLDKAAQYAARRLGARHPHLQLLTQLDQLDRVLKQLGAIDDGRRGEGDRDRQRPGPVALMRRVAGRRRQPSAAASPRDEYSSARDRALDLLSSKGQTAAEEAVELALRTLQRPRSRADLLGDVTNALLARGARPALIHATVAAELKMADRHLARAQYRQAAASFTEAMRVAFHRALHLDGTTSPLVEDPAGFVAPIAASATATTIRAPRGRVSASSTGGTGSSRKKRILLMTWRNANFLGEIQEYLQGSDGVEQRFTDVSEIRELRPYGHDPARIVEQIMSGANDLSSLVENHLRPQVEWADVVFIDWCTVAPVLLTMIDPRDTRVVVRLHSVEAFSFWPQLVDFSRIDQLVFVSEHLREFAVATVPALAGPSAPELTVLPLIKHLEQYAKPKADADTRFTLGLVGWSAVAKDPRWALDVVDRLHQQDARYRLRLIGAEFNEKASRAAESYGVALRRELQALEVAGVVKRCGATSDIPSALTEVGVILSSSVREGCHTALIEGAASGAVPVVRDWPFFARQTNGVRTFAPAEWVVRTPEEAVRRILASTQDEDTWRISGAEAQAEAMRRWDWQQVRQAYDELLLR